MDDKEPHNAFSKFPRSNDERYSCCDRPNPNLPPGIVRFRHILTGIYRGRSVSGIAESCMDLVIFTLSLTSFAPITMLELLNCNL